MSISSKTGQFSNPQKKEKPHSSLTDGRSICNARPKPRVCREICSFLVAVNPRGSTGDAPGLAPEHSTSCPQRQPRLPNLSSLKPFQRAHPTLAWPTHFPRTVHFGSTPQQPHNLEENSVNTLQYLARKKIFFEKKRCETL